MWHLGVSTSVDETKIVFQDRHQDKRRVTYKSEGEGFQADAIYQYSFWYQLLFQNYPSTQKYINMWLSPLHARKMNLFDTVYDEYHQCAMEKSYNYSGFLQVSLKPQV